LGVGKDGYSIAFGERGGWDEDAGAELFGFAGSGFNVVAMDEELDEGVSLRRRGLDAAGVAGIDLAIGQRIVTVDAPTE
jgi:hypothetical protein